MTKHTVDRDFVAPRANVWRAWTVPERLAIWYGPNIETVVHGFDLRPGGRWLCEMRMGGGAHFQLAEFTDVVAPEKLVFLLSHADADWKIIPSSKMPNWPLTTLIHLTLTETDSGTHLSLTSEPHGASTDEIACFNNNFAAMDSGWNAVIDLLAQQLSDD